MLARDVAAGLARTPKRIRTRWTWDARASELFDRIVESPEYELPRREQAILEQRAAEVAGRIRPETAIELGSGSSPRTGVVMDALVPAGLRRLVAVDVSEAALRASLPRLAARYPAVEVIGVVGDFELQLTQVETLGRTWSSVSGVRSAASSRENGRGCSPGLRAVPRVAKHYFWASTSSSPWTRSSLRTLTLTS